MRQDITLAFDSAIRSIMGKNFLGTSYCVMLCEFCRVLRQPPTSAPPLTADANGFSSISFLQPHNRPRDDANIPMGKVLLFIAREK